MRTTIWAPEGVGRRFAGLVVSVGAVALVTGVIFAVRSFVPVLSLGVLYVFAVLPVAIVFGLVFAVAVSVASMLAFNFFFLPPLHTLALRDSANWFALAVYVATAIVVSELAARSRRRAADAEQREREAAFLAGVSALLLETGHVQERLPAIAQRAATALGLDTVRIEVGSFRRAERGESGYDLRVGERHVGRLFVEAGAGTLPDVRDRVLPALASLLAVAVEREQLARTAVEAEALRRSDTVKTAILQSVSHDLRSPLTAIRAAGEGLERDDLVFAPADRAALLETIRSEVGRLERLVTNLIDLSRLEAGAALPRPELWTPDGLIARALETLGPQADRVRVELLDETAAVRVDGAHLERVLVNLIENALKFSTVPVEIDVVKDGQELVIRVRDHGPGLSPGELARVFQPFERGAQSPAHAGTGLGLAIARGFASANEGRVWVESELGAGAVFAVALPVADVPAAVRS